MTRTRAEIVGLHAVSPAEVKEWFECHWKPRPNDASYVEIAGRLSRTRWGDDPRYGPDRPPGEGPRWTAEQVADAARLLHAVAPEMVEYWEKRRPSPENNAAHHNMLIFRDAITRALPHIEHLGKLYARPKTKRRRPSNWHAQAIMIAHYVREALIEAGHDASKLSQNAPTIKIVHKALKRTKFAVERPAVAAYLSRREKMEEHKAEKLDAELRGMGLSLEYIRKVHRELEQRGRAAREVL
jgi:hypothetical protein